MALYSVGEEVRLLVCLLGLCVCWQTLQMLWCVLILRQTPLPASKLPGYTVATLAASMGINFGGKSCVTVYSNNRMMEVELKTGRYTQFY